MQPNSQGSKRTSELGYRESNPGLLRRQSLLGSESQRCYRYTIPDRIECGSDLWKQKGRGGYMIPLPLAGGGFGDGTREKEVIGQQAIWAQTNCLLWRATSLNTSTRASQSEPGKWPDDQGRSAARCAVTTPRPCGGLDDVTPMAQGDTNSQPSKRPPFRACVASSTKV
jgi:hypothetical protein